MVAPIDYSLPGVQSPFQALQQGMQFGAGLAQAQAQRQQFEAQAALAKQKATAQQIAIQRQQDYQTQLSAVLAKPNRTWSDWEPVLAIAPDKEQMDTVKALMERSDKRVVESGKRFTGGLLLSLESDPEAAKRLIDERVAAEVDPQQKEILQLVRKTTDVSPQRAAEMVELAGAMEYGKDWYDSITKAREQRRLSAKAPFDLRSAEALAKKAEADVDEAQIRLKRLDAIQEAELRKSTGEADAATIRAKFAERRERAELDLKSAQSAASRASTEKTNFEVQDLKRKADEGPTPVYNAQAGGFVVAPTKANPRGGFIPLNSAADAQQQQAALRALKSVNYDPVTGEDDVSKLIPKSTSGGTEALFAKALRGIGVGTSGMRAIAALETAAATITLELLSNRLGAGVSNTDREFVLSKLGDIANPNKTAEERLAGWISAKNRMLTSGMLPPPGSRNEPSSTADGLFNEADAILRGGR